ncbi:MAG: TetR/AcrR family transcriptional regulator [Prolixibacteraceae bacterium]|jgi:AcrR family transcriptional regulator|nr:TetR/AcrR family transcriptional regulator [Prolixibacteraceae bacterium]MDI9562816.1 TetR/AcrR family transcriptional regulator [Bacteroidota bacterium]NLS99761.1 TetR/AcrR family transcriptional regulator [Bacteroidales bacterium]OQB81818.1 MAG: HTH-type transcriptional repressor KstR2 [Bacteroidetes bacterium ADurb.Bin123]HNZ67825.1 TetR/AcrR family transcriptional regulator [Prolixibacteraceae bacterium]
MVNAAENGTKKDYNRENILKIAQDIFSKYGYKKTTLDDIANAVRKGKSSLYYYFKSKEDLFQAVIMKEVEVLARELDKVVNRNTDPVDKLRDYLLTKITTFRNLANFYNALENDVTAIGFIEEIKHRYEQDEIKLIKRILIEGVRKNDFEIYDFNLAAIGITMAIKGLEMPLSAGTYGNMNLERSVDVILKIICYGIMKR